MTSIWTDERVESLRRLAADGLGSLQIATCLTGATGSIYSRSAVIGKMKRMNIALRCVSLPKRAIAQHQFGSSLPCTQLSKPQVSHLIDLPVIADAESVPINIMGLTNRICHWPLWGEHQVAVLDRMYCGAPALRRKDGKGYGSYCRTCQERSIGQGNGYERRASDIGDVERVLRRLPGTFEPKMCESYIMGCI